MEYSYEFITEKKLLKEIYRGNITYKKICDSIADSTNDLKDKCYLYLITDLREAQINLTWQEMQSFTQRLRGKETTDYHALVVSRTVDFGMAKMYQSLAEDDLWKKDSKIFYDYEEAVKWIELNYVD